MASIGSANLTIVPKFDGLTASVNRALAGVDASAGGQKMGESLAGGVEKGTSGLSRQGALMGVFSTVTSKAMDAVASHVGSAASRLDTLKNYPTVMQTLGYSADDAQSSIDTMSDRLGSLPTRLDEMARTVQGLTAVTGDLGKATDVGLALNDMFLASGASTNLATAAGEQFRQMLSKGKPEMEDWKSLVSAAPGQMQQLATSMLGPTASAQDLYYALGGGKEKDAPEGIKWASISMDELMGKIVELDQRGGSGITSFKTQAETAAGGLQTSFENMGNAVTKGIANVMDSIGRDNITSVLNDVKGGINDVFKDVAGVARDMAPAFKGAWEVVKDLVGTVKPLTPAIAGVATALVGIKAAKGAFGAVSADMAGIGKVVGIASEKVLDLGGKLKGPLAEGALNAATGLSGVSSVLMGPWGVAIAAGVAGISLLVGHFMEVKQKQDAFTDATKSFLDATVDATNLDAYKGGVEGIGEKAVDTTVDLDGLTQKMQAHADAMASNNATAQGTIGTWQTVQSTIDGLIGKTELTTEEQGRLEWALKQVNDATGEQITQEDVLTGKYQDQNGEVQNLKEKVDELAQSKVNEARMSALSANLTEAYEAQSDALDEYAKAQKNYNDTYDAAYDKKLKDAQASGVAADVAAALADEYAKSATKIDGTQEALDRTSAAYQQSTDSVKALETELGNASAAASDSADEFTQLAATPIFEKACETAGQDAGKFADDLRDMGMSTDDFANMSMDSLTRLAAGYNGTKTSVITALQGMGDEGAAALSHMGADYAAMVEQCGGDTQLLTSMIEVYNSTPVLDKDGNVTMDATELIDANGNVIEWNNGTLTPKDSSATVDYSTLYDANMTELEWNGSTLVPKSTTASADYAVLASGQGQIYLWNGSTLTTKDGRAVSDTVSLVDGQKNIYTWNGTKLVPQHGTADVNDQSVRDATAAIDAYNRDAPQDHHATTTIDIIHNTFENVIRTVTGGSATGSVANAPYIPRHAAGYIAKGPTLTNNGWVGEDGIEAVLNWGTGGAVVPLTNTAYMRPIASAIAEEMAPSAGDQSALLQEVRALAAKLDRVGVYLDGRRLAGDMAPDIDRELGQLREAYAR